MKALKALFIFSGLLQYLLSLLYFYNIYCCFVSFALSFSSFFSLSLSLSLNLFLLNSFKGSYNRMNVLLFVKVLAATLLLLLCWPNVIITLIYYHIVVVIVFLLLLLLRLCRCFIMCMQCIIIKSGDNRRDAEYILNILLFLFLILFL